MRTLVRVLHVSALLLAAASVHGSTDPSPTVSAQVTTPQKFSVSLGLTGIPAGRLWGSDSGMLLRLEPGLSGGKLHLGWRSTFSMAFLPIVSVDLCGSVMYTWNDPWSGLMNDQTYLGTEFRATLLPVVISTGVYRHVAGGDTGHDWVLSAGLGLGF